MRLIIAGVAALALTAGTAYAQGQGQDPGRGKASAGASKADTKPAGGNAKSGAGNRAQPEQRGNAQQSGNAQQRAASVDNRARSAERAADRAVVERGGGNGTNRGDALRAVPSAPAAGRSDVRENVRVRDRGELVSRAPRGMIDGCPPGLAKKNPPCVPPGLARNHSGSRALFDQPDWWGLSRLGAGRYYYDDGYLVKLGSDGGIGSYFPLLGGALAIGHPWPGNYQSVALPSYYENFYGLGPSERYRYADDVIYRLDPQTSAITSIAALLTGDDFSVGQPMPLGYDVYNVPWSQRDSYFDRPDAQFRYADGRIYQVDPKTRLIAAAIELIAS